MLSPHWFRLVSGVCQFDQNRKGFTMSRNLQQVYLSRTRMNQPGLFTNGVLALSLSEAEFEKFSSDAEALKIFCARMRFEPVVRS
jgi:hypothetical protein